MKRKMKKKEVLGERKGGKCPHVLKTALMKYRDSVPSL